MLAGLSVDYIIRLEQGRAQNPSEQVVGALARVLQLTDLERDQLFVAAGLPAPLPQTVPRHIPGSVQRLLTRLSDAAISVFAADWTLITANDAWISLLGPMEGERNLIVREFTGTAPKVIREDADTERFRRSLVSDLRVSTIRYPNDPSLDTLVRRLEAASVLFTQMWAEVEVVDYRAPRKTFVHPLVGAITLDCDIMTVTGTDLRIVTYTAEPGTESASQFDLVLTLGVESMT
jgi:transcriptional regulator with XRE-family HTH domain